MAANDENQDRTPVEQGANAARRELLLDARVSRILDAHEEALAALIEGGFTLLAQAPLRWAMAHTVTLHQAFRIRGLDDEQQDALLERLLELGVAERLTAAPSAPDAAGAGPSEPPTGGGGPTARDAHDGRRG